MRQRRTRGGLWRAIVAVVALYAVALQGFLVGLRPPALHLSAICAPEPRQAPEDGRHDACCLSAHRYAAGFAALPPPAAAWARPDRAPSAVHYVRAELGVRPAAVFGHLGARGPPEA